MYIVLPKGGDMFIGTVWIYEYATKSSPSSHQRVILGGDFCERPELEGSDLAENLDPIDQLGNLANVDETVKSRISDGFIKIWGVQSQGVSHSNLLRSPGNAGSGLLRRSFAG